MKKIDKTDAQWREALPAAVYRVCREKGTEPPFTGAYLDHKHSGIYHCAACKVPLFDSAHKYDSGSGWPSYWASIEPTAIAIQTDHSHGMVREEVLCACCDAHLGHRFDDGPQPSGQRYCINSLALKFEAASTDDSAE